MQPIESIIIDAAVCRGCCDKRKIRLCQHEVHLPTGAAEPYNPYIQSISDSAFYQQIHSGLYHRSEFVTLTELSGILPKRSIQIHFLQGRHRGKQYNEPRISQQLWRKRRSEARVCNEKIAPSLRHDHEWIPSAPDV